MAIRANRDVLCFGKIIVKNIKNLPNKRDAPHHNTNSQNRGCPYLLFGKGALTVEAAFCATLFFLALFSMLYLFIVLEKQNKVQMSLADAVTSYETYGTKLGSIEAFLDENVVIHWKEEEGFCYVKQNFDIPFLFGDWFDVSVYQQMRIHSYDGKSMVTDEEASQEYVFITKNGKVYHKQENCVYLNPDIRSVKYADISNKRNSSGGIYYACEKCCQKSNLMPDAVIYYTPYGEKYHNDTKCSGLKRTIRKVILNSVAGMPACSKCGEN